MQIHIDCTALIVMCIFSHLTLFWHPEPRRLVRHTQQQDTTLLTPSCEIGISECK